jgi:hypothetical protein
LARSSHCTTARGQRAHGGDEAVHERQVLRAAQPLVTYAEVERVIEQVRAIRAHVERHRQRVVGRHTARDGVQGQLADRDRHAAVTLVADPQDRRRVGGHDHAHVAGRAVARDEAGAVDVVGRQVHAARVLVERRKPHHRLAHGRGVDDGQELLEVVGEDGVEQDLLPLLQRTQRLVLGERRGQLAQRADGALDLLIERRHDGRQQAVEPERRAFLDGERRPLVDQRHAQEGGASDVGLDPVVE